MKFDIVMKMGSMPANGWNPLIVYHMSHRLLKTADAVEHYFDVLRRGTYSVERIPKMIELVDHCDPSWLTLADAMRFMHARALRDMAAYFVKGFGNITDFNKHVIDLTNAFTQVVDSNRFSQEQWNIRFSQDNSKMCLIPDVHQLRTYTMMEAGSNSAVRAQLVKITPVRQQPQNPFACVKTFSDLVNFKISQ